MADTRTSVVTEQAIPLGPVLAAAGIVPTVDGNVNVSVDGDQLLVQHFAATTATIVPQQVNVPGPTGATGPQGAKGATGTGGSAGSPGGAGATGATGPQGAKGDTGAGTPGTNGAAGAQGPQGDAGTAGAIGLTGPTGPQGSAGGAGVQGPAGPGAIALSLTTAQTATASTTNLTAGAFTVLAGVATAGAVYEWEAMFYAGRGATTTATNVIVELLINSVVIRTLSIAISTTATQNRGGRVMGCINCRTVGAGGTAAVSLEVNHDLTGTAGALVAAVDPARSATSPGTTAIDTTQNRAIELRMRLSAATATCYLHLFHSTLYRG